jgi:hypothetical protein
VIIRVLLLGVCVLSGLGLVVSGADVYALRKAADQGDLISQPEQWVAFEASTTRVTPNGQIIAGRFYRGEDGSELSIENAGTPSSNVIIRRISNYSKGRYYQSSKAGEWTSGPLVLTGPRRHLQFFTKSSGLLKYRGKLALLAGQDGSFNAADGLDAWISTTAEGSVHLLVPSLNFYPVVSNRLDGVRRVLSEIRIGLVPASLFEPAAGDRVTFVEEPFPLGAQPQR